MVHFGVWRSLLAVRLVLGAHKSSTGWNPFAKLETQSPMEEETL